MAEEEKVVEAVEETAEKPAKKATRKPKAKKEEPKKASFAKPTEHDFEVIVSPLITEKTMALMQNANKVTVKVAEKSNKVEIKEAFQRIFQVKVTDVKVANQIGKTTTRGGRYKGTISGFKKAVITIAEGEAIDLFKE
ncbi:MAG: 50S ribosomal protein L23 [Erysipelotrichaceae bacterium]|jgi:large subunit ribosomal protein L23|nr:50S ribosomal protein L23 [Erysipelotrichaceae bacterium]